MKPAPNPPASPLRRYLIIGAFALLALLVVWVWWPREQAAPPPSEIQTRADQITERLKKAEGSPPPAPPQQTAPETPGGPANLRSPRPQPKE